MKICFPVEKNDGLMSEVYGHFGSAPLFVLYNDTDQSVISLNNSDLGHVHGNCNPIQALSGHTVDAIIVGGIGAGAIGKLNAMGIKVYRAEKYAISENLEMFKKGLLTEMNMSQACGHHNGCAH